MSVRTPIIAIVGRPNVGKSTLFNRLLKEKRAVVEDTPGVTRDRNYALVEHFSVPFILVDTGGIELEPHSELERHIVEQSAEAVADADAVIVLFDGVAGLNPDDHEVTALLRRSQKPVLYAVNKCDGKEQIGKVAEFYELGVSELADISALHGHGVKLLAEKILCALPNYASLVASHESKRAREREAELQAMVDAAETGRPEDEFEQDVEEEVFVDEFEDDAAEEEEKPEPRFAPVFIPSTDKKETTAYIKGFSAVERSGAMFYEESSDSPIGQSPEQGEETADEPEPTVTIDCISLAIVGRPNVGKSTLFNTIIGEQRAITSAISGTTRDAIDMRITREGQHYKLVDTAGLRKKARINDTIERFSTLKTIRALEACDVAVLLLDATEKIGEQDARIAGLAHEQGRGLVIVVNKWDAIEKNHRSVELYKQDVRQAFKFAQYAPIVFASALSGRRCPKIIETVREVAYKRMYRVPTGRLNRVLSKAVLRQPPPRFRGKPIRLLYCAQVDVAPPRFNLFVNYPKAVHFSYLRYLKNALRDEVDFIGSEIKLAVKRR